MAMSFRDHYGYATYGAASRAPPPGGPRSRATAARASPVIQPTSHGVFDAARRHQGFTSSRSSSRSSTADGMVQSQPRLESPVTHERSSYETPRGEELRDDRNTTTMIPRHHNNRSTTTTNSETAAAVLLLQHEHNRSVRLQAREEARRALQAIECSDAETSPRQQQHHEVSCSPPHHPAVPSTGHGSGGVEPSTGTQPSQGTESMDLGAMRRNNNTGLATSPLHDRQGPVADSTHSTTVPPPPTTNTVDVSEQLSQLQACVLSMSAAVEAAASSTLSSNDDVLHREAVRAQQFADRLTAHESSMSALLRNESHDVTERILDAISGHARGLLAAIELAATSVKESVSAGNRHLHRDVEEVIAQRLPPPQQQQQPPYISIDNESLSRLALEINASLLSTRPTSAGGDERHPAASLRAVPLEDPQALSFDTAHLSTVVREAAREVLREMTSNLTEVVSSVVREELQRGLQPSYEQKLEARLAHLLENRAADAALSRVDVSTQHDVSTRAQHIDAAQPSVVPRPNHHNDDVEMETFNSASDAAALRELITTKDALAAAREELARLHGEVELARFQASSAKAVRDVMLRDITTLGGALRSS